ncbi:polyprenyl synthetase family protein, partial [Chloroflexota bacterium]
KVIRPALTLLSGKFYSYDKDKLLTMATSCELLHIATLVHDDAIDKANVRRWRQTVNKLWGEDKAVLLGDYLFAKAGEFAAATENLRVVKLFAKTLETISQGELLQSFIAFEPEQTRDDYIKRISKKTAALFCMAIESGAVLSQAPEEAIGTLKDYGYNLGIAFQIVDDVLDFTGTEEEMGKPIGSDLTQGTITLPSMLLLERHPKNNPVRELFHNRDKEKNVKLAIELIRNSSIVDECYAIALSYRDQACRNLGLLPDNPSRQALKDLVDFVVSRKQ